VKHLCVTGVLVLGSAACSGTPRAADDIIPVANAITIYSAGGSVVSGLVDPAALGARRLRLPATVAAINLSQGNRTLKWFTVETRKDATYKLIGVPSLTGGELAFDYALPDITWTLQLRAEIVDAKSVSLQLLAAVNMNANETYKNCDVTLVLNNSVSVEKLSGSTFKISGFDLYPHRNVTYNLDNKTADYSFIREWNTNAGRDEVHVLLQIKNPFSVDLEQTSSSVIAHRIIVDAGSISGKSGPGEVVSLPAGTDDTISTFRSVKITEATDKRPLPFNHRISYDITNRSDQKKMLRLVTPRVLGAEHRSVYHFTQPPDATPENTLVWMLELEPGATRTLELDYDSDIKDVDGEDGFEKGG